MPLKISVSGVKGWNGIDELMRLVCSAAKLHGVTTVKPYRGGHNGEIWLRTSSRKVDAEKLITQLWPHPMVRHLHVTADPGFAECLGCEASEVFKDRTDWSASLHFEGTELTCQVSTPLTAKTESIPVDCWEVPPGFTGALTPAVQAAFGGKGGISEQLRVLAKETGAKLQGDRGICFPGGLTTAEQLGWAQLLRLPLMHSTLAGGQWCTDIANETIVFRETTTADMWTRRFTRRATEVDCEARRRWYESRAQAAETGRLDREINRKVKPVLKGA